MDSVTWLVLLRESVDCERYLRPFMGISSNTGLVRQGKKKKVSKGCQQKFVIVTHRGSSFRQIKKKHKTKT